MRAGMYTYIVHVQRYMYLEGILDYNRNDGVLLMTAVEEVIVVSA